MQKKKPLLHLSFYSPEMWGSRSKRTDGCGAIYIICGILIGCIAIAAVVVSLTISSEDYDQVVLNQTTFSRQEIVITVASTVRFANPAGGVPHRLCLATHFECIGTGDGPKELQVPGVVVTPGQTLRVSFPVSGDYQIISVGIPAMALTIHVHESPPFHGM